jgi:signal transduction histidine kinase
VHFNVPHRFTHEETALLQAFAQEAAVAIHKARLFEQVRVGRERLQSLSRRLVELQEAERRHIARELHDEIGQVLTGLQLVLEMGTRVTTAAARRGIGEAKALVHELISRVRELSLDLRPAMLDDLGLLPALLWHIERYTAQTKVKVTFEHAGLETRFSPEAETAAYRIVQEALTNVARHAAVDRATVVLGVTQDMLCLQIQDTGVGFDPHAALLSETSSGLAGMRERATLLGGRLVVESVPGAGTRVTAELPLSDTLERRANAR